MEDNCYTPSNITSSAMINLRRITLPKTQSPLFARSDVNTTYLLPSLVYVGETFLSVPNAHTFVINDIDIFGLYICCRCLDA